MKFEEVCSLFSKYDCAFLDKKEDIGSTVSTKKRVNWKCKCGKVSNTMLGCYQLFKYHCCKACAYKIRDEKNFKKHGVINVGQLHSHSLESVSQCFKDNGCTLLSTEYTNAHNKLQYICSCGVKSIVRFCDFKNKGTRCRKCAVKRREETNLIRFGHKVPLSRWKEFVFPSGRVVKVQGYETRALTELLDNGFTEESIVVERQNIPCIQYIYKNKLRRYYPDIYIPSMNKIIEVKSSYTYKLQLVQNILKALATRKQGYEFEFWMYDDYGVKNVF